MKTAETQGKSMKESRMATLTSVAAIAVFSIVCLLAITGQASAADVSIYSDVFSPLGPGSEEGALPAIIGRVIRGIIAISGVLALLMFVYGGLMWMTSGGNKDKVEKAKKTVVWSILGLIMIFASFALVTFVLRALGQ